jgi:hypothetical protein
MPAHSKTILRDTRHYHHFHSDDTSAATMVDGQNVSRKKYRPDADKFAMKTSIYYFFLTVIKNQHQSPKKR